MKELIVIQSALKAPKGQYNSFGKYKYRSCEDILEALKPLLKQENCFLTIQDDIISVGDRYYVKATVTLANEDGDTFSTTAFAREADRKTGMDESQITGTASSYARKYALNGLFCIDDTKDADTDEQAMTKSNAAPPHEKSNVSRQQSPVTDPIATAPSSQPSPKKKITMAMLNDAVLCDQLLQWAYKAWIASSYAHDFDVGAKLLKSYDADQKVVNRLVALFNSYKVAKNGK